MTESPLGSKPSADDVAQVKAGTASAHDRAEVARYNSMKRQGKRHPKKVSTGRGSRAHRIAVSS